MFRLERQIGHLWIVVKRLGSITALVDWAEFHHIPRWRICSGNSVIL